MHIDVTKVLQAVSEIMTLTDQPAVDDLDGYLDDHGVWLNSHEYELASNTLDIANDADDAVRIVHELLNDQESTS